MKQIFLSGIFDSANSFSNKWVPVFLIETLSDYMYKKTFIIEHFLSDLWELIPNIHPIQITDIMLLRI